MGMHRLASVLVLLGACSRADDGSPAPFARPAEAKSGGGGEGTSTEAPIDPKDLAAPWRGDYERCVSEAAKLYDVGSFVLVRTREGGEHRFLYFHDPDEMSSEDHFACRIHAKEGHLQLLHEG